MNNIAGMDVHVQRRQPQGTGLALAAQPLMPAQPTAACAAPDRTSASTGPAVVWRLTRQPNRGC